MHYMLSVSYGRRQSVNRFAETGGSSQENQGI